MIISALGWNDYMTKFSTQGWVQPRGWNFNPASWSRVEISTPGVELSPGLKILSCNRAFDFDRVLYYRQGWNFNPVNRAEFNPGVENAPCNRPLTNPSKLRIYVICKIPRVFQNHPQRYEKQVWYYSDTAINQRKIRWLERDLNSHLRVSRPIWNKNNMKLVMDLFPNEQNFDLDKSRQKFHHSLKVHTDRTRFGNATRIFNFQWHLTSIFFYVFQIFGTT